MKVDFNKWDRIFLTHDQQADLMEMLIAEYDLDHLGNGDHPILRIHEYPLKRFILTVPNATEVVGKEHTFHHCYTMAGEHLDIRTLVEDKKGNIREAFEITVDLVNIKLKKKSGASADLVEDKFYNDLNYWSWLMLQFMIINTYILSDPEKLVDVEEREVAVKPVTDGVKRNRPPRKGPNKVRLVRSYRLKKRWKTALKKRIQEIRCPAWGVRGHFRHLKNGNVIFIQPYVKGKERDKYQGKVYDLLPKEA